jgi:23S rRNA (adenine2503-C2)-methyltransferase
MARQRLIGKTETELGEILSRYDPQPYRGRQVFHALYRRRVSTLDAMTDLPRRLRQALAEDFLVTDVDLADVFTSRDGTRRYLLRLCDGIWIEAVWIPEEYADTICLSTQAGCPVACTFCMTGRLGLRRQLEAGEILSQVVLVLNDRYGVGGAPERGTNLVFMGMGEPLLNYENVMRAVRLLCHPKGLGISARRITLSTIGVVPRLRDLAREPLRPELAISLSAPTDELRDQLIPLNRRWPLAELMKVCRAYPLRRHEWISFEYVMLDGINDHDDQARQLVRLLQGLRAKVNLIPHNPAPELPYRSSPPERIERFQSLLRQAGILTFIRQPRGRDIDAACGQLAARQPGKGIPSWGN